MCQSIRLCIVAVKNNRNVIYLHTFALLISPEGSVYGEISTKMAKTKELSLEERKTIIKLHQEKKTEREIAKICSRTQSTIHTFIQHIRKTGSVANKPRSGRPSKVSDRLKKAIIKEKKNKSKNFCSKNCRKCCWITRFAFIIANYQKYFA